FERALNSGLKQVCVSTVDLPWRIEQARFITQAGPFDEPTPLPSTARHPRPELRTQFTPAASEMEKVLETIWQDLLGLEQIGVTDNFFELGGHSLLATQIVSRVRSTLEVEISVREIFEAPTIGELALVLDRLTSESDDL